MTSIGIIGGGAWGTALAQAFAVNGSNVLLWAREAEVVESINAAHENMLFLKGIKLSPALKASADLAEVARRDILLLVTPAQHLRSTLKTIKKDLGTNAILVNWTAASCFRKPARKLHPIIPMRF